MLQKLFHATSCKPGYRNNYDLFVTVLWLTNNVGRAFTIDKRLPFKMEVYSNLEMKLSICSNTISSNLAMTADERLNISSWHLEILAGISKFRKRSSAK